MKNNTEEKNIIDINEVLSLKKRLREINKINIKDAIFIENDTTINIPQDVIDKWQFTGLNISDFVEMEIQDNPKYFPYVQIAKKKLEEARKKCISNYARNGSGILWKSLWKFEDGKYMTKTCTSGCFIDWHIFENEDNVLKYMINELKTIDELK